MDNSCEELSIIVDAGLGGGHACGYCGGRNGSVSHGMPVRKLTVYAYQDLIDQGWRRSGTYLYKPDMTRTCCKAYTIRLDVNQFTPDKQHRRLLRKWHDFLAGPVSSAQPTATSPMESDATEAAAPESHREEQQDANSSQAPQPPEHVDSQQDKPGGADQQGGTTGLPDDSLEGARQEVERLLAAALASAITAGELPGVGAGRAAMTVRRCTEKQRRAVHQPNVYFTSSSAFALAAAAAAAVAEAAVDSGEQLKVRANGAAAAAAATEQSATTAAPVCKPEVLSTCTAAAPESPNVPSATIAGYGTCSSLGAITKDHAHGPTTISAAASTEQQQRKREATSSSALCYIRPSAQMVAEVLSRYFNMLCIRGLKAATGAAACSGSSLPADAGVAGVGEEGRSCREGGSDGGGVTDALQDVELVAGGEAPDGPGGASGGAVAARIWTAMEVDTCASGTGASLPGAKYAAFAANGHVNVQILGEVAEAGREAEGRGEPSRSRRQQQVAGTGVGTTAGSQHGGGGGCARGGTAAGAASGSGGGGTSMAQDRSRASGDRAAKGGGGGGSGGGAARPGTKSNISGAELSPPPAGSDPLALPSGRLQVKMVPSTFLEEEFELYCSYQVSQHGDSPAQLSRGQYKRFLVDSPMGHVGRDRDASAPECGYGSFHQQYWLDGKLVAVGVVDVLPRCLSSVYFFWNTQLASLALGRFSALQEIQWVQHQAKSCPDLHYYYMGFYIHTCPKMRYKAEYRPSDLLCPVRKVWVRITPELMRALEQQPFLQLSNQPGALCQPNLAAPAGSPGPAAGSFTSQQHSATQPPAAAAASEAGNDAASTAGIGGNHAGDPAEDVGDTLVCWQGSGGPVPFKVLESHKLMSQRAMGKLRQSITQWREVVGWTAPSLVYQL